MNPALQMRIKRVDDSMEGRGFLADELVRPYPVTGFPTTAAQVFGEDNSIILAPQRMLALHQDASGNWHLQRGWLEDVEITGTGPVSDSRDSRIILEAVISYEYDYLTVGEESLSYNHYKTGRYRVESARVVTQAANLPIPPNSKPSPGSETPAGGYHREVSYREINSFSAEGQPSFVTGQGWLQIGPSLTF